MPATFAGIPFRIQPESVRGGMRVKTSVINTQGGKVIQVLGTVFEDLIVSGSFGKGGYTEQTAFLQRMIGLAQLQEQGARKTSVSFKFEYPERGWDFLVMLKGYSSPDGPKSIHASNTTINPRWTLTLAIINDNGVLQHSAAGKDAFIERLSNGLGWHRSNFNGPMTPDSVGSSLLSGIGG